MIILQVLAMLVLKMAPVTTIVIMQGGSAGQISVSPAKGDTVSVDDSGIMGIMPLKPPSI